MTKEPQFPALSSRFRRRSGASLAEVLLMLVCVILAMASVSHIVTFYQHRQRCDAYLEQVRRFAMAFQDCHRREGRVPPGAESLASFPKPFQAELRQLAWDMPSPFGGTYEWISPVVGADEGAQSHEGAAPLGTIIVTAFPPRNRLNFSHGDLRYLRSRLEANAIPGVTPATGFAGWPSCHVYPKP